MSFDNLESHWTTPISLGWHSDKQTNTVTKVRETGSVCDHNEGLRKRNHGSWTPTVSSKGIRKKDEVSTFSDRDDVDGKGVDEGRSGLRVNCRSVRQGSWSSKRYHLVYVTTLN